MSKVDIERVASIEKQIQDSNGISIRYQVGAVGLVVERPRRKQSSVAAHIPRIFCFKAVTGSGSFIPSAEVNLISFGW